jgi:hypothetical protein
MWKDIGVARVVPSSGGRTRNLCTEFEDSFWADVKITCTYASILP